MKIGHKSIPNGKIPNVIVPDKQITGAHRNINPHLIEVIQKNRRIRLVILRRYFGYELLVDQFAGN